MLNLFKYFLILNFLLVSFVLCSDLDSDTLARSVDTLSPAQRSLETMRESVDPFEIHDHFRGFMATSPAEPEMFEGIKLLLDRTAANRSSFQKTFTALGAINLTHPQIRVCHSLFGKKMKCLDPYSVMHFLSAMQESHYFNGCVASGWDMLTDRVPSFEPDQCVDFLNNLRAFHVDSDLRHRAIALVLERVSGSAIDTKMNIIESIQGLETIDRVQLKERAESLQLTPLLMREQMAETQILNIAIKAFAVLCVLTNERIDSSDWDLLLLRLEERAETADYFELFKRLNNREIMSRAVASLLQKAKKDSSSVLNIVERLGEANKLSTDQDRAPWFDLLLRHLNADETGQSDARALRALVGMKPTKPQTKKCISDILSRMQSATTPISKPICDVLQDASSNFAKSDLVDIPGIRSFLAWAEAQTEALDLQALIQFWKTKMEVKPRVIPTPKARPEEELKQRSHLVRKDREERPDRVVVET